MAKDIGPAERAAGGLVGLAVGDALGLPAEFEPRSAREADPILGMRPSALWGAPAGTWSDDTSLALCLAASVVERAFDPEDAGRRFLAWLDEGLWSAAGEAFGVGGATRRALDRIRSGLPAVLAGGRGENDNGNGSLMRALPASAWLAALPEPARFRAVASYSAITHGHPRSLLGCWLHCLLSARLLEGLPPRAAYEAAMRDAVAYLPSLPAAARAEEGAYARFLDGSLALAARAQLRGSGYVVHCLEAATSCLLSTGDFASCVLAAVNLGEDADTTGAVAGGLAGLAYGLPSIPREWAASITRAEEVEALGLCLGELVAARPVLPRSYWILPGKLLGGPKPLGESDLSALLEAGFDGFIDLRDEGEAEGYGRTLSSLAAAAGMKVALVRAPMADYSADEAGLRRAADAIGSMLAQGRRVYLHCAAGVGRTSLAAGAYIAERGLCSSEGPTAILRSMRARGLGLPDRNAPASGSGAGSVEVDFPETEEQGRLASSIKAGPSALPL